MPHLPTHGLMGHISLYCLKFADLLIKEYAYSINMFSSLSSWSPGRNRVQNYKKFCTYANFALIFYVDTGTIVVVGVNMDMKFGELVDIVEAFEVSA